MDTETTGLRWYNEDSIVGVVIADDVREYYFNMKDYGDGRPVIEWHMFRHYMEPLFLNDKIRWFLHNAKFDLNMLYKEDILVAGPIHDTMVCERLLDNNAMSISLKNVALKYGEKKSDAVQEWLDENEMFVRVLAEGKKKHVRNYFWDKVPLDILAPYACQDARITYQIGNRQRSKVADISAGQGDIPNNFKNCYLNEMALVKAVFHMEQVGVLLDVDYCMEAMAYSNAKLGMLTDRYKRETGSEFKDSAKSFAKAIPDLDTHKLAKKTGNVSYEYDALVVCDHPMAKLILEIRETKKNLDFFHTFMQYKSTQNTIHASFNQAGTKTGRFSCSEPNLQQLTKVDEDGEAGDGYPVRRALVPRPGHFFAMLDYDQQEYRMMVDLANVSQIISKINQGLDVHEATAEIASRVRPTSRKEAKSCNFAVLYGAGNGKLGSSLKIHHLEAKKIRDAIFEALPNVPFFIDKVAARARRVGHIKNWLGRITHFERPFLDTEGNLRETYYRAPNALIQGGCADVVKVAMVRADDKLKATKTRLVLTVHDELVLEVPYDEWEVVPKVQKVMESVYVPRNKLPLTVSVEWSDKSLADKRPWTEFKPKSRLI